jgi:biotin carboxylase
MTDSPSVLVVEPTSSGYALITAARQLGMRTVVASRDDGDRTIPAEFRGVIDTVLEVETNDEDALTAAVTELHARQPLSAVLPGFEFYVDSAARIAARLGLPGLPAATVTALRDKTAMRQQASAAGLRVPRFAIVAGERDLDGAAAAVGFPLVVKPASACGSVHVSRCDDLGRLHAAYQAMQADPRTDMGRGLGATALVEEYVPGPEISAEGYVSDGAVTVVAITAKLLGPEPYFVETGHIVQADLDPRTRAAVDAYVAEVCHGLGLTLGSFHCELRIPGGEPVLIEIGARLPGDHIVDLVNLVTGVSLPRIMMAAHAGLDLATAAPPAAPRAKAAGIGFFTAPGARIRPQLGDLSAAREAPDVIAVEEYPDEGEPDQAEDFRSRYGHVIFTADSEAAARQRWDQLRALLAGEAGAGLG